MLAIGVTVVVMGLFILPSNRDIGIVTLAMFGSCTAVFAAQILSKYRFRKFTATAVEVAGGVPIRPRRGLGWLMGSWMLALGVILIVFGASYPAPFRWLAGFVAVVGVVLLIATALGLFPGGYLQFDPDALTIGQRRWSARIPWDAIGSVHEGEFSGNPILLIAVNDVAALAISPPDARTAAYKSMAKSAAMFGAEFAIMTTHYGIDLPVLAAAVTHYARDAEARRTLTKWIGAWIRATLLEQELLDEVLGADLGHAAHAAEYRARRAGAAAPRHWNKVFAFRIAESDPGALAGAQFVLPGFGVVGLLAVALGDFGEHLFVGCVERFVGGFQFLVSAEVQFSGGRGERS